MKTRELFVATLGSSEGIVVRPMCDSIGCGTNKTHTNHIN